ncbi:hypothetical protein [Leptospira santarosai]|uniref:Uncharacterized protein n=1 Tax=Leptospira santarosai serovar Shermani str. LT 821 TaxID=758847 RepID=K8XYA7_9LEPT|nr:hypothetical protein [Leptospira santarosai]EKT85851.1 hypothetical protein LSS_15701 [Leptospira santarosai serovar Shermani str. LT 821]OLY65781.1 hypothetical protein BWD11_01915 [Leptospira santarosai serovar Grippotyphosa]ONF76851.1 hypothetical protein BWD12_17405 [Leptospira santarosai serovar Bananal]ASV12231.1 hypothetical protein B2G51_11620 [Leptospira santarosai]EKS09432.1 hypothetical protein LEP1GSC071_3691 [Leptospira santarosai str. JET]
MHKTAGVCFQIPILDEITKFFLSRRIYGISIILQYAMLFRISVATSQRNVTKMPKRIKFDKMGTLNLITEDRFFIFRRLYSVS